MKVLKSPVFRAALAIALGALLVYSPNITSLMYVLGAVIVIAAIGQYVSLASVCSVSKVSWPYWIAPTAILLTGVYLIVNPSSSDSANTSSADDMRLLVLGLCFLIYGVSETANAIKIYFVRRTVAKLAAEETQRIVEKRLAEERAAAEAQQAAAEIAAAQRAEEQRAEKRWTSTTSSTDV